jgi:hypothetical protein
LALTLGLRRKKKTNMRKRKRVRPVNNPRTRKKRKIDETYKVKHNPVRKFKDKLKRKRKKKEKTSDGKTEDMRVIEKMIDSLKKKIMKQNNQISKSMDRTKKKNKKKKKEEGKRKLVYVKLTMRQCTEIESLGNRVIVSLQDFLDKYRDVDVKLKDFIDNEEESINRLTGITNFHFNTHNKAKFFSLNINEKGNDILAPKFV